MRQIPGVDTPNALHSELCAAISDLAKSVDVAVKRITLRAKTNATIAAAKEAELLAETLRTMATQSCEPAQVQPSLVPVPPTEPVRKHDTWTRDAPVSKPVDELWQATKEEAQRASVTNSGSVGVNAIAMCIRELHREFGDLKSR
jgi:hypothetical protein